MFINDVTLIIVNFMERFVDLFYWDTNIIRSMSETGNINDVARWMSDTANSSNSATTTSTISTNSRQYIHNDGNWSDAIRTLFIYGTGALRLHLLRGVHPFKYLVLCNNLHP